MMTEGSRDARQSFDRLRLKRKADVEARQEILIVDDIPSHRELLQQTLESQGYEIIAATSGETGLSIAQETHPDLILLDIMRPADLDGLEICRRLKANPATQGIPVIFIAVRDDDASIEAGFEAGAVDYITRPFRKKEIQLRVETHLKASQSNRSLPPVYTLPKLPSLPDSLPLDGAVRIELQEGVPVLRASKKVQRRMTSLLQKQQQEASLAPEEVDELDQYEEVDTYLSLINRVVRNQFQAQRD